MVIIGIRRRLIQQSVVWSSLYTICGLSLSLVLSFAPRSFCPDTQVFPSPQKPTFSKFQFDQESGRRITTKWMYYLQIIIYLFIYIKLDINYKRTANEHPAESRTYKRHIEFCKADRIT